MSITEAPILVRNGEQYDTSSYLDAQTRSITLAMVAFAPEYGLASTIAIVATVEADVTVDFAVNHFQSMEGPHLEKYRWACIIGFVLALVILIDKVVSVRGKDFKEERLGFLVDVVVQVFLPIIYFATRLSQAMASKGAISETVGVGGLAGVPWASRSVSLSTKIGTFFESIGKLQDKLSIEYDMSIFYFVHATSALFRLIFQTSTHPRTAILVNTITRAAGDLWHWIILFVLVNFGFVFLGIAQFGSERSEFSSLRSTFVTLWEMLLGAMLENKHDLPSTSWGSNWLITSYLLLYNFLVFMIMYEDVCKSPLVGNLNLKCAVAVFKIQSFDPALVFIAGVLTTSV
jgi:hypothetical protein